MIDETHLTSNAPRIPEAAIAVCVSKYGLISAILTSASLLGALSYLYRIAHASNGSQIIELSEAQTRLQVEIVQEHADSVFELGRGILVITTRPFRTSAIIACCVVL